MKKNRQKRYICAKCNKVLERSPYSSTGVKPHLCEKSNYPFKGAGTALQTMEDEHPPLPKYKLVRCVACTSPHYFTVQEQLGQECDRHCHKNMPHNGLHSCCKCQDKEEGIEENSEFRNLVNGMFGINYFSEEVMEVFEEFIEQVRQDARREVAEEIINAITKKATWEMYGKGFLMTEEKWRRIKLKYLSREGDK